MFNPGRYCLPADVFSFAILTWELFSTSTTTGPTTAPTLPHGQGLGPGNNHSHGQIHGHGSSSQPLSASSSLVLPPSHAPSRKINPVCGLDPYEATGKLEQGLRPAYSAEHPGLVMELVDIMWDTDPKVIPLVAHHLGDTNCRISMTRTQPTLTTTVSTHPSTNPLN